MLIWDPIGLPDDHDEFSYLLQAETFNQGSIANVTTPFKEHFESFHILLTPTYASKYPPGQAFFLFTGMKLFGHPWYGVVMSCMLMIASIVWMIRGYTGTKWALIVGIFIVFRFSIWNYWSSSYWGGAVAAMGGALVFGALPRLSIKEKFPLGVASLCLGLGLSILSQSRPFEGLVVSLFPMLFVFGLVIKHIKSKSVQGLTALVLPATIVILVNFAFIAHYNKQITGDYFQAPYQLHSDQYSVQAPLLVIDNRTDIPNYNHEIFEKHYNGWEIIPINSIKDFLILKRQHFRRYIKYFFYWPFILALTIWFIYSPPIRIPFWSFFLFCLVMLAYPWFHPHYFAPILSVYYLLLVLGIRYLVSHRNKTIRSIAQIGLPVFLILTLIGSKSFSNRFPGYINGTEEFVKEKQKIIDELSQTDEKHLVLVKYSDSHPINEEWVYNGPDLDNSQVIWGRYMTKEKNQKLKSFYKDRKIWLIEPDTHDYLLTEI